MRLSAIGYAFREMQKAGIRIHAAPYVPDVPEEANLVLWDKIRFTTRNGYREQATGETIPVAWWFFEHKVGERTEMVVKTVKKVKQEVPVVVEDYEPGLGDNLPEGLRDVLLAEGSRWVFDLGITAELRDNNPGGFMEGIQRYEWLECNKCEISGLVPKKYGPATANYACHLTPYCTGKVKRLPQVFFVESPRTIPKRKIKPIEGEELTPGARRFKERQALKGDADDEYDDEAVDTEAA